MKILLVHHHFMTPAQGGSTRHYQLLGRLVQKGHDVQVIASAHHHLNPQTANITHTVVLDNGIKVAYLKTPGYRTKVGRLWNMGVFALKVFGCVFSRHLKQIDVVIGSSPSLLSAYGAYWLARLRGKPFLLEVRDIWPEGLLELGGVSPRQPLIRVMGAMAKSLYRRADEVISVLPGFKDYAESKGCALKSFAYLPNFIDTNYAQSLMQPDGEANDKFTFYYTGSMGIANDMWTLVRAAELLQAEGMESKIAIKLVGDGPERRKLENYVKTHGLSIIEFLPRVSKEAIYPLMQQADAFIWICRRLEVFKWGISPNKLFDYFYMSKPIVLSGDIYLNPVEGAKAGLSVPPESPEALMQAMVSLFTLPPAERQAMGERGRAYAIAAHTLDVVGNGFEQRMLAHSQHV